MPPSYSMMLPGRMSTPLIFMIAYLLTDERAAADAPRLAAPLAVGLFPGKQRVRIDRRAVPPALAGRHAVHREVKVRAGSACVAGMADAPDHLTALDLLPLVQAGRVGGQVRIIIDPLLVGRTLVDGGAAADAVEQLFDRAVRCRNDRRAFGSHDVDGVMTSPLRARCIERVGELVRLDADDRQSQARR